MVVVVKVTTKAAFITTRHRKQHRLYHNNLCYTHEYFFHTQGVVLYYIERVVSSVLHLVVVLYHIHRLSMERKYINFWLTRGGWTRQKKQTHLLGRMHSSYSYTSKMPSAKMVLRSW